MYLLIDLGREIAKLYIPGNAMTENMHSIFTNMYMAAILDFLYDRH